MSATAVAGVGAAFIVYGNVTYWLGVWAGRRPSRTVERLPRVPPAETVPSHLVPRLFAPTPPADSGDASSTYDGGPT